MNTMRKNLSLVTGHMFAFLVCVVLGASTVPASGYAIVSYFDVVEGELTGGPPYPTLEPTIVKVFDKATPILASVPLEQVTFNYGMTPPELGTTMEAMDSGGGLGTAGTVATFAWYLEMGSPAPPQTTAIEMFLKIESQECGATVLPGPTSFGDSFFDVFFDAELFDGGVQSHHLHGEIGLGEALPMEDMSFSSVVFDNPPAEAFDCYLQIEMNTGGDVLDPLIPLMTVTLTGTYVPEPATLSLLGAGACLALLRKKR